MSGTVRWTARWVVPVAAPPIRDGAVVTAGDRITWVGPAAGAPPADRDEALGDAIVTPGLVNAHTHLDLTVLRGALDDLRFFDWVRTLTRLKREVLTADDLRDAAHVGVAEGLARGITTFGDTADNDAALRALLAHGARGVAFREVFGPDPAQCEEAMGFLAEAVARMRAMVAAGGTGDGHGDRAAAAAASLVRVGVSPHAPYSVSDALFRAVADFASRESLPVAVHVSESAAEDDLVIRGAGPFAEFLRGRGIAVAPRAFGPIPLLDAAGLLRATTLLIHCVRASQSDVARIADTGCGVAHCPASNAKLGHGVAPLKEFLAAGARVGLGSDSMASNDAMDLLAEARLAALQQRALTKRPDALPARAAFRLATLGGAEALRMDDQIGSLSPGKQADLAVFRMDGLGAPVTDPVAALVFAGTWARADRVVVGGVERVREGRVLAFDAAAAGRVGAAADRVAEWRRSHPSV